ncbi:MAG: hypothetical protein ACK50P_03380, partial [Planctomycetaceae bacterium]
MPSLTRGTPSEAPHILKNAHFPGAMTEHSSPDPLSPTTPYQLCPPGYGKSSSASREECRKLWYLPAQHSLS